MLMEDISLALSDPSEDIEDDVSVPNLRLFMNHQEVTEDLMRQKGMVPDLEHHEILRRYFSDRLGVVCPAITIRQNPTDEAWEIAFDDTELFMVYPDYRVYQLYLMLV